jgi:phosphoribosylformimino-5-aminoimidazole carboxamide ribotide isomerase
MITIIPAIDIIDGKCVRLTRGKFGTKKIYNENPLEVANAIQAAGIRRLHMVDLDGARQKEIINWKVLEKVAIYTSLEIDFGGGIQSDDDIELAFNSGASQVVVGSIAVKNKEMVQNWMEQYGREKLILGADVKDGKIAIHAWKDQTEYELFTFLEEYYRMGFQQVICTDISRDGVLEGPSFALYESIKKQIPDLDVIASGGVGTVKDITKLEQSNIDGVIIGKALYEGKIKLEELKSFLC